MDTILTSAQGVLDTLTKMPSILLYALALNVVGWVLKRTPLDNRHIPITIIGLAAVGMPFLLPATPPGEVNPAVTYPVLADWVRRVSIGLVLGLLAWAAHATILKHLEDKFPGLKGSNQ